jgi:hypothetical protein
MDVERRMQRTRRSPKSVCWPSKQRSKTEQPPPSLLAQPCVLAGGSSFLPGGARDLIRDWLVRAGEVVRVF